ncbi:serine/threonine protein kinase [Streptosporangium becharense]|uniref:serine/threonine-protein kinase n=1 Tax=Streptosporangium becharense TaxID=1816182 RepID=UPI00161ABE4B|nr:serine/threonine-protein kinase [Streptosporangium becharense]MBB2912879.1 serine/threonine protein kinase [Streptosporangium becharense]
MTERKVAGRYRLLEPLGEGGMGVVWRAHDELLDRVVAVKEVHYRGVGEEARADLNRRTIREARTAGRLDHPSVVVVHDVVEEDGRPWIVMQLVRSRSLGETVRSGGPLPPERVAAIGLRVLSALRAAHDAGVLHRDVKPENVLLADDGRVVLTDFGIASMTQEAGITRTGGVVGTPAFLPPERLHNLPATPESDLWSLGATLYAALEGRPPFERATPAATMMAVLNGEPSPMSHTGPLATVILGLLAGDPAARMTAEQAEALLSQAERGGGTSPGGNTPHRPTLPLQPDATAYGFPTPYGVQPPFGAAPPGEHPTHSGHQGHGVQPPFGAAPPGEHPTHSGHQGHGVQPPFGAAPPEEHPTHSGHQGQQGHQGPPPQPPYPAAPTRHGYSPYDSQPPRPEVWPQQASHGAEGGHEPVRRSRAGRPVLLIGVVALVAAVGVGGWLAVRGTGGATDDPGGTRTTAPVAGGRTDSAETPEPSAEETPEATPTPSSKIPAGWKVHRDPLGFSVAVPRGWEVTYSKGRNRVEFREPGSEAFLWIESTEDPEKDPLRHWEKVEQAGTAQNVWPEYERVGLTELTYQGVPAADWEFTYVKDGVRRHVLDRGFRTREDNPYAIYWESPDSEWDSSYFDRFVRTFRP